MCEQCQQDVGSCDLYCTPSFETEKRPKKAVTRKDVATPATVDSEEEDAACDSDDDDEIVMDYFAPDTVCAVAPEEGSRELMYFMYVVNSGVAKSDMTDSYNHEIKAGQDYIHGHYLEKDSENKNGTLYRIHENNDVYFFKESIIYPFVNVEEKNGKHKKLFLPNADYCDIIHFIEESKMALL